MQIYTFPRGPKMAQKPLYLVDTVLNNCAVTNVKRSGRPSVFRFLFSVCDCFDLIRIFAGCQFEENNYNNNIYLYQKKNKIKVIHKIWNM